ncbi:MAG: LEA type 2 family protein [Treponema sp.]|jgi:LEA14-like dessication related protein|nr:LEA type 2 family protein [Treponema sp.]
MKNRCFFPLLFFSLFCCLTCKSPPPPPEETPVSTLYFDHIEAESISRIVLYYRLWTENPLPLPLNLKIGGWKAVVDGHEYDLNNVSLACDTVSAGEARIEVPAGGGAEKMLRLDLNLGASPAASGNSGDYRAELRVDLVYQYDQRRPLAGTAAALAVFPRIREPEFTITAIAIMQAELINTRFRVSLRIDNPNVFPVDLSSFGYELYGAGRFWADGREEDVLHIPALGSAETRLFLMMNFINMKRSLLDEVIALRQVRYRFTGEAEVGTGVSWLPRFHMGFDHTGNSAVYK